MTTKRDLRLEKQEKNTDYLANSIQQFKFPVTGVNVNPENQCPIYPVKRY